MTLAPLAVSIMLAWPVESMATAGPSLDGRRLVGLALNTAAVCGLTLAVAFSIGVPLGSVLFRAGIFGQSWWRVGLLAMCAVPPYLVSSGWMALTSIHLWPSNLLAAGFLSGLAYLPLTSLLCGLVLSSVDSDQEDAAILSGTRLQVFWHITLPQVAWGICGAAIIVAALSTTDITVTDLLQVRTFSEEVFAEFQLSRSPGSAAALAAPLVGLFLVIGGAAFAWAYRNGEVLHASEIRSKRHRRISTSVAIWAFFLACIVVLAGLPVTALLGRLSGVSDIFDTLTEIHPELLYSAILSLVAAILTAVLALPCAYAMSRGRVSAALGLGWLIVLLTSPAPLLAIGLTRLLNREGWAGAVYDSPFVLVLGYILRFLPFHVLVVVAGFRAVPRELEEAAACDGASGLRMWTAVVIPLTAKYLLLGAAVVLVLSLGEVGSSVLLSPPGQTTIAVRFYTLLHYGVYAEAAAVGLILLIVVLLPALVATVATKRWLGLNPR